MRQCTKSSPFAALAALSALLALAAAATADPLPGGSLDPVLIPKYEAPLLIPPTMPMAGRIVVRGGKRIDYYEIAVRQFEQQILPPGFPLTTVWGYGSETHPGTLAEGGSFHYPACTIEARWQRPLRVKWINGLVDEDGGYLPHLLPVDQTLHWANPPGPRDHHGLDQEPYTGPVPFVTHMHGAHVTQESDGFPQAWCLPAANNIPDTIQYTTGTYYDIFKTSSPLGHMWEPGVSVYEYPNDQRATTLWYHDHSLGMTRLNVYAGPVGFYLLRGGPDDLAKKRSGGRAILPGEASPRSLPAHEIPLVIQDKSFNADGSLFYPSHRAFFSGLEPEQLRIPFVPEEACGGPSDISKIWNPMFFGNTLVVNGRTWPYLEVEPRRYRLRFLNGCTSRFLILKFDTGLPIWQIGSDGGFLEAPVELERLILGSSERADCIVDFGGLPAGSQVLLLNVAPDGAFTGGQPGVDFDPADPGTTGQVMLFRLVEPGPAGRGQGIAKGRAIDRTTPPLDLLLPAHKALPEPTLTRRLSLNGTRSSTVFVVRDAEGNIVLDCENGRAFGPNAALLGTVDDIGVPVPLTWNDAITENPALNATEDWRIFNFTGGAHPVHVHLVQFRIVARTTLDGLPLAVEPQEAGWKDTFIAMPGTITTLRARFDIAGLYVWHCHILEHEDNEMMRPMRVGPGSTVLDGH